MRIVVDTNVLLNAILPTSGNYWLFEGILSSSFTLCVSNEVLTEYAEIFGRFYGSSVADNFLTALIYSPSVEKTEIFYRWQLIRADPDDDKFVDTYISSGADYLVTNDSHFRILRKVPFPNVSVLSSQEFATLLQNR